MNREQEDILLEDYIESLREESNWSVSFSEHKVRQHNKKEGERIKKMQKK